MTERSTPCCRRSMAIVCLLFDAQSKRHNTETLITLCDGRSIEILWQIRTEGRQCCQNNRQTSKWRWRSYMMCDDTVFQAPTCHRAFPKWPPGGPPRPVCGTSFRTGLQPGLREEKTLA